MEGSSDCSHPDDAQRVFVRGMIVSLEDTFEFIIALLGTGRGQAGRGDIVHSCAKEWLWDSTARRGRVGRGEAGRVRSRQQR